MRTHFNSWLIGFKSNFNGIPEEHIEQFDIHKNAKNAMRLPVFFMFLALHHLAFLLIYDILEASFLNIYHWILLRNTNIIYTIFYFILLILASVLSKKFSTTLISKPKITHFLYFLGISLLIFDDIFSLIYFDNTSNIFRFLLTAPIIALVPFFSKKLSTYSLLAYFLISLIISFILQDTILITTIYLAIITLISFAACVKSKNYHISQFIDRQNIEKLNLEILEKSNNLAANNQTLLELSNTDSLTKINNRRAFDEYIKKIWCAAIRNKSHIAIMMIDIDHFKHYNDNFGHLEGDKCLIKIAQTISQLFRRQTDMFARFGGEEFIAVIPFEKNDNLEIFAQKIRKSIEDLEMPNPAVVKNPFVTVSIGVASCIPEKNKEYHHLIGIADQALYAAKNQGRNKVITNFSNKTIERVISVQSNNEQENIKASFEKLDAIVHSTMLATFTLDLSTGFIEFGQVPIRLGVPHDRLSMHYSTFVHYVLSLDKDMFLDAFPKIMNKTSTDNFITFRVKLNPEFTNNMEEYAWVSMKIIYLSADNLKYPEHFDKNIALGTISDFTSYMQAYEISRLTILGSSLYSYSYEFETGRLSLSDTFIKDFDMPQGVIFDVESYIESFALNKEDVQNFKSILRNIKNGETDEIEYKLYVLDDSTNKPIWLMIKGKCSRDFKGNAKVLAGSIQDITDQIRHEELNSLIIEGSSDCIFVYDLIADVVEFSPKIFDIIPLKSNKMTNAKETWLKYILPQDHDKFLKTLNDVIIGKNDTYRAEFRVFGTDDTPIWIAFQGKCKRQDNKPTIIAGSIINLKMMRQYGQYVEEIRNADKLSGLPNRLTFNQEAVQFLNKKEETKGYIIMIDIDDFSNINSLFGLFIGDKLLTEYGALLTLLVPHDTKLYHFESNLFVIHHNYTDIGTVERLCNQIRLYSSNGLLVEDVYVKITVSIGVAEYDAEDTIDDIVINAELALKKAKNEKNKVDFFSQNDKALYLTRLNLETEVKEHVLDSFKGFEVFYQPFYSISHNMVIGAEALLRWRDRAGKIISPAVVIPALQSIGMFNVIENWILQESISQCGKWIKETGFQDLIININLSPKGASGGNILENISKNISEANINLHNIFLEITEESLVMDSAANMNMLKDMQDYGIRMAIDDFGTGYSSLGYLRNMPVCELKIDRSFITDIETNAENKEFIGVIIQLCHIMNFIVCVEGVETLGQVKVLAELNADILQGYHFSRPLPAADFQEKFLTDINSNEKYKEHFKDIYEIELENLDAS